MLARGVASRWQQPAEESQRPMKVVFITGADYARDFADACRADTVDAFGQRVRRCNLLVIDALDELADRIAAQEHLCRTLDALADRGSHCIATSRVPPAALPEFIPALIGRLTQGLAVPVSLPSESTRAAMAARFAQQHERSLDAECCRMLSNRLPAGVLPLQSAVAQLAMRCEDIALADVTDLLNRRTRDVAVSLTDITKATAKQFATNSKQLKGPSRRTTNVRARGLAMLAARTLTCSSYSEIGRHFGGRDHSTVMHACRKTESLIETDAEVSTQWSRLLAALGEHHDSIFTEPNPPPIGENLLAGCSSS